MKKRVVVTGLGIVAPNGTGKEKFLDSIQKGISGIKFIEELKNLNFGCQIGGVPDYTDSPFLSVVEKYGLSSASKTIIYSVLAALEAWRDAGIEVPPWDSPDVDYDTGIIIGSGIGSVDIFCERITPLTQTGRIKKLRSTIVEHAMLSGPSANLAGILAVGNQVSFNSSACSTGTESIINGYERILSGKAKRMIVGAADAYSPFCWSGFDAMRVTTWKHNDAPASGSRPMSATASGFVPGAGAGILVIEELETALQRNARIYAEIMGCHINAGGQRNGGTMSAPNPEGVIKCLHKTIEDAGVSNSEIDYICGHLSSTMADPIEIKNWAYALNRKGNDFPYINSLKSMIGHCIGAAGSMETISAILQMNHGFLHPSLNCEDIHPEISEIIDEEKIPHTLKKLNINCIAKSSFGFGDVNACLILKKI
ncbi:MAG: beta-ketoacyl-[acyl-carrier-protein] synthase family protein [Bacteroidia bacterium]|nr:beta-ketoacyl-[acyl-carrier-protein] synthase family protein [Bacteroidia bacterium]